MTKEKQIDEIAKFICNFPQCVWYNSIGECANTECQIVDKAEALYNAGYRRQSEGEWIDKPTGAYGRMQSWCSACGKHSGIGGIESNRHKPYCPHCGAKMKGGEEE